MLTNHRSAHVSPSSKLQRAVGVPHSAMPRCSVEWARLLSRAACSAASARPTLASSWDALRCPGRAARTASRSARACAKLHVCASMRPLARVTVTHSNPR